MSSYIDLINNFWQKDIEYRFTDKEICLYFYLLSTCNSILWKNPFGLSNSMTIVKFGWGKTSFDNAKNRLKAAGLIDFKAGDGRGNVYQYLIVGVKKGDVKGTQKSTLSKNLSDTLSNTLSKKKPATSIDIDKEEEKDNSATNVAGAGTNSSKKNSKKKSEAGGGENSKEATAHWKQMVDVWFKFYEHHYNVQPTFKKGPAPKALKSILERLQQLATQSGHEWTEDYAINVFKHFLTKAIADKWRKENFMLHILNSHFDAIIQKNEYATSKDNQSGLGNLKQELARKLANNPS